MALRPRLMIGLCLLAVLGASGLAIEVWRWTRIKHYNQALTQAQFAQAARYGGEYGLFAEAYAEQQRGNFQQARIIYSRLERTKDEPLRLAVLFNLGNTYLEQASSIDLKKDADLALPLIELAKGSYRELLKIDSQQWDARYNLERALQLSPDVGEERVMEYAGRRGTVRTVISADPEGALP
jgi:mxaK protein